MHPRHDVVAHADPQIGVCRHYLLPFATGDFHPIGFDLELSHGSDPTDSSGSSGYP
jgi:hypothetical protein